MRLKKYIAWPVLLMGLSVPALMDCSSDLQNAGKDADPTCSEFKTGSVISGFDANINAVVQAGLDLQDLAAGMQTDVKAACKNIAVGLGVADDVPAATTDDALTQEWCNRAQAAIKAKLQAAGSAGVTVQYTAPKCAVDVSAEAQCEGTCSAKADCQADVTVACEPGKLAGGCSGSCTGACNATVEKPSVECEGTCDAQCTGKCAVEVTGACSGTCNGTCSGTCDVQGSGGKCAGKCNGTCTGTCEAEVTGSCTGTCKGGCAGSCKVKEGSASAACNGECKGQCAAWASPPRCEGSASASCQADAKCKASCSGRAQAKAECTPPTIKIVATGTLAADTQFVTLLQEQLKAIYLVTMVKGELAGKALGTFSSAVSGMVSAPGNLSIHALGCVKAAVEASVKATASVNVSVQASASVSGSASGGT